MNTFPWSDWILHALFIVFVACTIGGALLAVGSLRIIRAVCGLALSCIGLAGLFYFLGSPFLALMEILIYVGAVCVTIIFAVMLAEPDEPTTDTRRRPYPVLLAGLAALLSFGIFLTLARLGVEHDWPLVVKQVSDASVAGIGRALLTTYALPFELISLVLLVAIIGALAVARAGRRKE